MDPLASSSQPIALPPSQHHRDHIMASMGSYTGSNGDFNPASYTRHFLGSPISWRPGSFGARIPSSSPTAHILNSFDPATFKMSSSSIEGDRSSLLNAFNVFDREGELCRNYTCCGLHLNDLHALLEHFEQVHLVVLDPSSPQNVQLQVPFNPQSHPPLHQTNQPPSYYPAQMPSQVYHVPDHAPSDPDDMELELDLDTYQQYTQQQPLQQHIQNYHHHQTLHPPQSSAHSSPSSGAPTPPDTPVSTPLSCYPSPSSFLSHQQHLPMQATSPYASQPSSPQAATFDPSRRSSNSPPANPSRPNLNLNLTGGAPFSTRAIMQQNVVNPEDAFNPYARFASDYSSCLPGAQNNAAPVDEASMHPGFGNMSQNGNNNGANALQSPHLMHLQHGFMGQPQHAQGQANQGVAPALLFSSNVTTPCSTPSTSRVPSPTLAYPALMGVRQNALSQGNTPISSVPTTPISPTSRSPTLGGGGKVNGLTRHASTSSLSNAALRATSSLLLSKPFKCPKPNCNKSYKQANGLKYHITHGSCNFAPPKDLEHVKDLLERKRRDKEREAVENGTLIQNGTLTRSTSLDGTESPASLLIATDYPDLSITETELREVEREAERRLRPYACGVGDCQRRYKNMNGLRYHYQHSGEHGAVGLAMLASGQHECLAGSSRHHHGGHNVDGDKRVSTSAQGSADREGRRRIIGKGGSMSVPVSRATSTSRTGTPVPLPTYSMTYYGQQSQSQAAQQAQAGQAQPTQAQPFTPPSAQSLTQQLQQQYQSQSQPVSPTHASPQHIQQQQQLAYQAQLANLQRQQYAVQLQQQQQYVAMYQQQYQQQQLQQAQQAQQLQQQQQAITQTMSQMAG